MTEKYRELKQFVEGLEKRLVVANEKSRDLEGLIEEKYHDYERAIMRNEDTKQIVEVINSLKAELESIRNEIEVIRKLDTKAHIRQEKAPLINEIIAENTNGIENLQRAYDSKEHEIKQTKDLFFALLRDLGEIKRRADELANESTNSHECAREDNEPKKYIQALKVM